MERAFRSNRRREAAVAANVRATGGRGYRWPAVAAGIRLVGVLLASIVQAQPAAEPPAPTVELGAESVRVSSGCGRRLAAVAGQLSLELPPEAGRVLIPAGSDEAR